MSVRRLFDFAHHAAAKFPKEDMFATKYHGVLYLSTLQTHPLNDINKT